MVPWRTSTGLRQREAVGFAVGALAPHLTRYRRSLEAYAEELRARWRSRSTATSAPWCTSSRGPQRGHPCPVHARREAATVGGSCQGAVT
ncbi:tetratricopeptide repeat protein [Modestobacter sp. Leaf380]|uniref:tetratricopeptide repeat protein n=1 Tax=Modestobacter sp. Leaf380 TaxID=1736356 RepID=UPI0009E9E690